MCRPNLSVTVPEGQVQKVDHLVVAACHMDSSTLSILMAHGLQPIVC